MKLTLTQIKVICDALTSLDGYDRVITVDGKDKIVKQPYNLSGKARLKISRNIGILTARLNEFNKVRNELITEISEGQLEIKKEDTDKQARFFKEIAEILQQEDDVDGILDLSISDLKLDSDLIDNPIPSQVINDLSLILK